MKRLRRLDRVLYNLFKNLLFNTFIISAILFSLKASEFSREHLYITYLMLFTLILFWRYIAIKLIYLYRKSGYNYKRVLIIGGGEVSDQLYKYFNSDDVLGVRLEGIFSDQSLMFETKSTYVGTYSEIKDFAINNNIDEIYYTLPLTYTK